MNTLHPSLSRREMITRGAQAVAAGFLGSAYAAETKAATSETLVQQLYGSMDEAQRKTLCFGWSDPRRLRVDNNWHINFT
jgi:hypothetical protein